MNTEKHKRIAIILIVSAIGLGAIGAHFLRNILSNSELNALNIGVRYQLFHGLSLLVLALNAKKFNSNINKSLNLMTTGICLFSFSIYLLSFQKSVNLSMAFLGPITPIGGVLLITSWITLFFSIKKID
ncbi:MAG: hypothetical protein CMD14_07055 [Flavobacteriales bacterium]|nr:hypothetical protein [Flavobacteriales bacterium]